METSSTLRNYSSSLVRGNPRTVRSWRVSLFRDTPGSYTHKRIFRDSNDSGLKPTEMFFSGLIETPGGTAGYLQAKWGTKTTIGIGIGSDNKALVNVGTPSH